MKSIHRLLGVGIFTASLGLLPFLAHAAPEPISVSPAQSGDPAGVITVIYQGHTFELNLPEQNLINAFEPAPTDHIVETAEPQPEPPAMSQMTLRLSELYPNTIGSDVEEEYVEIENFGDVSVDLLGWSLRDASEKTWTADGSYDIGPGAVLALPRSLTNIVLNNNEDTLELVHPNGQVIDIVSYGKAEKGSTYTRSGEAWSWQHPASETAEDVEIASDETEVEPLVVPEVTAEQPDPETDESEAIVLETTEETEDISGTKTEPEAQEGTEESPGFIPMTITQARSATFDTRVETEGVVTAPPNTFAKQSFYIQSDAGIQVYMYTADFPELSVGDRVRVQGVTSQNRGESRIKLSGRDAIQILGTESVSPQSVELDIVSEGTESQLIVVEALVESARSDEMTLVQGETELLALARERTGTSFASITSGSTVRVTGIVSESNESYRLLPRSQEDIHIVELAAQGDDTLLGGTTSSSGPPTGIYGGILLLSSLGLLGFWHLRSRKDPDLTLTSV